MESIKRRIEKFVASKPTRAEIAVSYSLLGLSIASLLTVITLVIIKIA